MMFKHWFTPTPKRATAPTPQGEGVVRLSTRPLIALHHQAAALTLATSTIRSAQSGGYVSRFKGRGMEFDEVRPYQQGDDVRTLDWRVLARTGRPHTKLFREERERAVLLCIDLRDSMLFATRGAFKAVRAAQAAALLGWSAVDGGDRVGALLFDDNNHQEHRPRGGKSALLHLFKLLGEETRWQRNSESVNGIEQSLLLAIQRLRRVASPGSLIFILSDFSGLNRASAAQLTELGRHSEVVLGFCHDPLEAELPPAGHYRVSDGRQSRVIDSGSASLRQQYHARFESQRDELQRLARLPGVHLLPLSTSEDPLAALQRRFGASRGASR
jgi:uncharacterized protein (DUF58 family)